MAFSDHAQIFPFGKARPQSLEVFVRTALELQQLSQVLGLFQSGSDLVKIQLRRDIE